MSTIQLQTDCILQVPLTNYQQDFTFVVNGKQYLTNKFIADLLSSNISRIHETDPTASEYSITTKSKGNFSHILDLLKFDIKNIDEFEVPFFTEIIDKLNAEHINLNVLTPEITIDSAIKRLLKYEKSTFSIPIQISKEIEFLASHFYELKESQIEEIYKLKPTTIEQIISHKKLELDTEDQLLTFINELYSINQKEYSTFYEHICFTNVSSQKMVEFISLFDIENMNNGTWTSLCDRLCRELIESNSKSGKKQRYRKSSKIKPKKPKKSASDEFTYASKSDIFNGIFSYFRHNHSIKEEVEVSCLSLNHGSPESLLDINNSTYSYCTNDRQNSWICFEFKKRKIRPSAYTIKSTYNSKGMDHLKSWIIEGSVDGFSWKKLDEQKNCSLLNGENLVRTFPINVDVDDFEFDDENEFKFLRIKQTDKNWHNRHYLEICAIDFFGKLI